MKLNQIIAILSGVKAEATKAKTLTHRILDKTDLFNGLSRTYEPRSEERYPYRYIKPTQIYLSTDRLIVECRLLPVSL